MKGDLSFDAVAAALSYCPESGAMTWKLSRGKAKAGDAAGAYDERGYCVIGLLGKRHYAHRLAVLLETGQWPSDVVDHIDGDRSNNRWSNLRCVSVALNTQNRHIASHRSQTGVLGVRRFRKKFRAAISIDRQQAHLGTFDTVEDAHQAYLAAKREFHEGCTL